MKSPERGDQLNIKKKMVFVVDELDTLLLSAKPVILSDIQFIDINDKEYPLKKRRASLIK